MTVAWTADQRFLALIVFALASCRFEPLVLESARVGGTDLCGDLYEQSETFGLASDGTKTVTGIDDDSFASVPVASLSGAGQSDPTAIHVDGTGLRVGDEVLIIEMAQGTGWWETCMLAEASSRVARCDRPLTYEYDQSAQVVRMPHWEDVTISSGARLTTRPFDGASGGVVAFRARGAVTVQASASIDANGQGRAGGLGGAGGEGGARGAVRSDGEPGAIGSAGLPATAEGGGAGGAPGGAAGGAGLANGSFPLGGGGAGGAPGGGGGGGFGTSGASGEDGSSGRGGAGASAVAQGLPNEGDGGVGAGGSPGEPFGTASLFDRLAMGAGGGGGAGGSGGGGGAGYLASGISGGHGGDGGMGGPGGGIVLIFAASVSGSGSIEARGDVGGVGTNGIKPDTAMGPGSGGGGAPGGGGGGGSGGAILVVSQTVTGVAIDASPGAGAPGGTSGGAGGDAQTYKLSAGGAPSAGAGGGGAGSTVVGDDAVAGAAGSGGGGGEGRIHVHAASFPGPATPAATLDGPPPCEP